MINKIPIYSVFKFSDPDELNPQLLKKLDDDLAEVLCTILKFIKNAICKPFLEIL